MSTTLTQKKIVQRATAPMKRTSKRGVPQVPPSPIGGQTFTARANHHEYAKVPQSNSQREAPQWMHVWLRED